MLDILCEATVDVFLFRFCCRPAGDLNHPEEWEEDPEKMVSRSVWSFACVLVCFFFACFFFAALHPDQIPSRSVSSFAFVFVCLSLVFLFVVAVFVCLFVCLFSALDLEKMVSRSVHHLSHLQELAPKDNERRSL